MFAIDAHLDLAMNAVLWDRDLKLSAHETRAIERRRKDDRPRAAAPAQSGCRICARASSVWSSRRYSPAPTRA